MESNIEKVVEDAAVLGAPVAANEVAPAAAEVVEEPAAVEPKAEVPVDAAPAAGEARAPEPVELVKEPVAAGAAPAPALALEQHPQVCMISQIRGALMQAEHKVVEGIQEFEHAAGHLLHEFEEASRAVISKLLHSAGKEAHEIENLLQQDTKAAVAALSKLPAQEFAAAFGKLLPNEMEKFIQTLTPQGISHFVGKLNNGGNLDCLRELGHDALTDILGKVKASGPQGQEVVTALDMLQHFADESKQGEEAHLAGDQQHNDHHAEDAHA